MVKLDLDSGKIPPPINWWLSNKAKYQEMNGIEYGWVGPTFMIDFKATRENN